MKRTVKKFIFTFLCLIMIIGSITLNNNKLSDWLDTIAFTASAEICSGKCGDNITWQYDSIKGTLTLTGTGDMYNYSNETDTPWYDYSYNIYTVTISDGITKIGERAFLDTEIETIEIPDSVTYIDNEAFRECMSLSEIKLPDKLAYIGDSAFSGCALKNIVIPDSVTYIGSCAFEFCGYLENITLPENLTKIDHFLFYDCSKLKTITLPDKITTIGSYAFGNCTSLESAVLSPVLKTINSDAFYNCTSLKKLIIPNSVEKIYTDAFACMSNPIIYEGSESDWQKVQGYDTCGITDIIFSIQSGECGENAKWNIDLISGVLAITGSGDMNNYKPSEYAPWYEFKDYIKTVTVDKYITEIGDYAFADCNNLENITLSDNLMRLGEFAFFNCTSIKSVKIPDNVITIGIKAFENCELLESITLSESVNDIKENTFDNCKSLKSITIPNSVTDIYANAFLNCESLESVILSENLLTIGDKAFSGCSSLTGLIIPHSVNELGNNSFEGITDTITYKGTSAEWKLITNSNICGSDNIYFANKIVSFNTNGVGITPANQIISAGNKATKPTVADSEGYILDYWYEIKDGENSPFNFTNSITEDITLYAKWTCIHDWTCEIITNPTSTQTGQMKRICSRCGETEEIVIPKLLPDYPTSVTLDRFYINLCTGETDTLTVTVNPGTATDKSVIWESSDTSVVTVTDGVITAITPGTAIITVKSADNRYNPAFDECLVYVSTEKENTKDDTDTEKENSNEENKNESIGSFFNKILSVFSKIYNYMKNIINKFTI